MKKLLNIALCLAMALVIASCGKTEIKVISYNVRVDVSEDGENCWDNRKQASINMINAEKPTIFGLQEAQLHQYQYLKENLPQYGSYGLGREDGASYGEHMAIFYDTESVEMLDCGTFWLSETPEVPSRGWDAMCKRSCTWARLKMKANNQEFIYMNTHLDHYGPEARRQSLMLIAQRIEEIAANGEPVFLTADFNSTTDQPIYEPIKAMLIDSRQAAPATDHRATLNCWERTHFDDASWVIDHIFVRGVEPKSFRVLDGDYGAPFISDHYPVILEAEF